MITEVDFGFSLIFGLGGVLAALSYCVLRI
jgi:hypothetical protein